MKHDYIATTNGCKLCKPLGAAIAFKGIEGCVPFLHGSQGCATYMRRYIISHFNEPIDIASSSLGEKHAIHGGGPNLKLGLKNVSAKYGPKLIGLATTCLTETIGDNVPMILHEYRQEFADDDSPAVVTVSTPSYAGSHMEGFHAAVRATVDQLAGKIHDSAAVNLLPGFVSPADIRYLAELGEEFDIELTILPDYSATLDGPAQDDYPLLAAGGTPLRAIANMGGAKSTLEFGLAQAADSGGTVLEKRFGVPLKRLIHPVGLRATDQLMAELEKLSGRPIPGRHREARGRLIDAMVDGHKYLFGRRALVYGEEDLVAAVVSLLAEIGIHPILCASGGKSGKFGSAVAAALESIACPEPEVIEDVDFYDIEARAEELGVDLVVGHSKGYGFARRRGIPMVRVGFPIHDRMGGQRILHLGYQGAQQLFDQLVNTIIAHQQDSSPVGYSYM